SAKAVAAARAAQAAAVARAAQAAPAARRMTRSGPRVAPASDSRASSPWPPRSGHPSNRSCAECAVRASRITPSEDVSDGPEVSDVSEEAEAVQLPEPRHHG